MHHRQFDRDHRGAPISADLTPPAPPPDERGARPTERIVLPADGLPSAGLSESAGNASSLEGLTVTGDGRGPQPDDGVRVDGVDAVGLAAKIRAAEEELKDSGRVVIRYSGTEALARVMIEAESEEAMQRHATAIADAIRAELGA